MKKLVFFIGLLFLQIGLLAQYANDWVDYNQKYLKIAVGQDGVYRIPYNILRSNFLPLGIDVNQLHPGRFQIFANGVEVPLFISGDADNSFDAGDFIEFFGKKNNGLQEAELYPNGINDQINPYYSLFNDTAWYFITIQTATSGKRFTNLNSNNYLSLSPINYILRESLFANGAIYNEGRKDAFGKSDPGYNRGEGWVHTNLTTNVQRNFTLNLGQIYQGTAAPNIEIETKVAGSNSQNHQTSFLWNGSILFDTLYSGYIMYSKNFQIAASTANIGNNTLSIGAPSIPGNTSPDRQVIGYVSIKYPSNPNFLGSATAAFKIPSNFTGPSRISASNFSANPSPYLYDLSGENRIEIIQSGNNWEAVIPSGDEKAIYAFTQNNIATVSNLHSVQLNGSFIDFRQSAQDSSMLIITHNSLLNAANNYAIFKSSAQGGAKNVQVIDVDFLYDQFDFGIQKSPNAIRNFLKYAYDNYPSPPAYLFLVGKSVSTHFTRKNTQNFNDNLVPTYGFPSCDNLLATGLGSINRQLSIPTGRLIAKRPSDIGIYLNKVQQFEASNLAPYSYENKAWKKEVLHFAGGSNANEQRILENYLNGYSIFIEDTSGKFGGNVTLFSKSSTNPVQGSISEVMREKINNGVTIMNFFGHSSGAGFDISIDNLDSYENQGKYPLVIANSCFIGDLHAPTDSFLTKNEEFLLTPNKGAIGFLASVSLGYSSALNTYTSAFIRNFSNDLYGRSTGKIMQKTIDDISNYSGNISSLLQNTIYEMTLHGDPSLTMNKHQKSELVLRKDLITLSPQNISTALDSFTLQGIVSNVGKTTVNGYNIEVKRKLPDGSELNYEINMPSLGFEDYFELKMPVLGNQAVGQNELEITVDPFPYSVDEFENTLNNKQFVEFLVISDELIPVYPENYGIIGSFQTVLKGSTANLNAAEKTYFLEVDTLASFNSAFKKQFQKVSKGGVIDWPVDLSVLPDSTVVYWRTAPFNPDSSMNNQEWRQASFRIIEQQLGWSQAHIDQLDENQKTFLERNGNRLDFGQASSNFYVRTLGNPPPRQDLYNQHIFSVDGIEQDFSICFAVPSLYVMIIDPVTLVPWGVRFTTNINGVNVVTNPNNFFNNANDEGVCGGRTPRPTPRFLFRIDNPNEMAGFIDMIENHVPDGLYILMHTAIRGKFQDASIWTPQRVNLMQNLGANNFSNLSDSVPYIFFTQKGNTSKSQEIIGTSNFDVLDFNITLQNNGDFGILKSPIAGPAKNWSRLKIQLKPNSIDASDTYEFTLFARRTDGSAIPIDTFQQANNDIDLSTLVDANTFPYLFLEAVFKDQQGRTAPQLSEWTFLYEPYPEYAVDPNTAFYFHKDSLMRGEEVVYVNALRNLTPIEGKNVSANYRIRKNNGTVETIKTKKLNFTGNQTIIDTLRLSSLEFSGLNLLTLNLNPRDSTWIPEKYTFNNQISRNFYVQRDNLNPLLDVTFDGVRILDGDIVSAQPMIQIRLKDDNPVLAIEDSSSIDVYLEDPSGNRQRVPFVLEGAINMQFFPASLPENMARIEYQPAFSQDGKYKLKVDARDASGNPSGDEMYAINFEVINRSTITQVMNYPNPFTTSTRFVFTLTGSRLPDFMRIQILSISGRVVREIDMAELGPINIGRNITDFAWDGTDSFGDRLANGVYLYRVITKIDGEEIEHRSTGADNHFHKGFGKMYLFR